jgi:hypothetical protein
VKDTLGQHLVESIQSFTQSEGEINGRVNAKRQTPNAKRRTPNAERQTPNAQTTGLGSNALTVPIGTVPLQTLFARCKVRRA